MTEFDLIKILTSKEPKRGKGLLYGIGDDCAVIAGVGEKDWLVTTDALIENVHFKKKWMSFLDLGRKSLLVNLSDIAAMGGVPRFFLVSIGLPSKNNLKIAKAIYKGMQSAAKKFGVILIGGDTVCSPKGLMISITVIGECGKGRCLYRKHAKAGDAIYVTGVLGKAALSNYCLMPVPRIDEGMWLANSKMATSMIDISDGLLADLGHIVDESGVGYVIYCNLLPYKKDLKKALTGGEDYELIFTVPKAKVKTFERMKPKKFFITKIGEIVADKKCRKVFDEKGRLIKIKDEGFDHFF